MHMAMVMGAGVLLLVVFVMFGWLWGASAAGMAAAAKIFMPVWLLVAATTCGSASRTPATPCARRHRSS